MHREVALGAWERVHAAPEPSRYAVLTQELKECEQKVSAEFHRGLESVLLAPSKEALLIQVEKLLFVIHFFFSTLD